MQSMEITLEITDERLDIVNELTFNPLTQFDLPKVGKRCVLCQFRQLIRARVRSDTNGLARQI